MSLTDSCGRYQKFRRQERESASPVIARGIPKVAYTESPLVKGQKWQRVPGSVYPKYSLYSTVSPARARREISDAGKKDNAVSKDRIQDIALTPTTHLPARVPKLSASAITPARRILVENNWHKQIKACSRILIKSKQDIHASTDTQASTLEADTSSSGSSPPEPLPRWQSKSPTGRLEAAGQVSLCTAPDSLNTADAAGDEDGNDDSSPLTHNKAVLSHTSLHHHSGCAHCSKRDGRGALSSFSAQPKSKQLHLPHLHHQRPAQRQEDEGDIASASSWMVYNKVATADPRPTSAKQSAANSNTGYSTQKEILARLQVLDDQKPCIQHEMQLLKMAMQREQEEDGNGNHVPDVSAATDQANSSNFGSQHLHPASGPTCSKQSLTSTLEQRPEQSEPLVPECIQMAPSSERVRSSRPGQLLPDTTTPEQCHDAFCNIASSAVDSDSSSSPDVNSNIIIVGKNELCVLDEDQSFVSVALTPGASCFGWSPYESIAKPKQSLAICSEEIVVGKDDGDSSRVKMTTVDDIVPAGQKGDLSCTIERIVSQSPFTGVSSEKMEKGPTKIESEVAHLSQSNVNVKSEIFSNIEFGSRYYAPSPMEPSDQQGFVLLSSGLPGHPNLLQTPASLRQSVDMEVEDCGDTYNSLSSSAKKVHLPIVPQAFQHVGPAGQDQPPSYAGPTSDQSYDYRQVTAILKPVSVIVGPTVVLSPPTLVGKRSFSLQVGPPFWTIRALHSAANNNTILTPSKVGASSEVEAVAATLPRSISLSPKLKRRGSPSKRSSRLGTRNRSFSPPYSPSRSTAKEPVVHSTLRLGQKGISDVFLKTSSDMFLEALLEDECALYAGRLQSFFRDSETSSDRMELSDPVAKILNEGDDMHFIPICEESSYQSQVREGSALVYYVPV